MAQAPSQEQTLTKVRAVLTEEQQAKVFQAFVQADSKTSVNYGGTGLGLAIVSNFCDMLGGNIELTSAPGEGSRFDVSLPIGPA